VKLQENYPNETYFVNSATYPDSLTRQFVDLLADWSADSSLLLDQCRLLLLDGLAVALAGAAEPGPGILAKLAQREAPTGPAHLIGKPGSTGIVQAARVNGTSMHVLDYEPMWNPPNHALSPLLPALLALSEQLEHEGAGNQGRALLRAIAKGVEAQGRLRLASGQLEPAKLSMHPPGAVGAMAAALACAQLMGLSKDQTLMAISIAASRVSGVLANVGTMTKALHCGDGAAHGLESALMAAEGFTANTDAIGSPRGWGPALFGSTFAPQHLLAPVGKGRALEPGPSWKLFPSQFGTHFGITASLEARAKAQVTDAVKQIKHIALRTSPMPYIDRPHPENGLDGKFSWQYTSVLALLDGKVTTSSFKDERRFASDVDTMLDRFELTGDASISGRFDQMYVEITLDLFDGTQIIHRCDAPLGSWTRPVPPNMIREKALSLMTEAANAQLASQLDQVVMGADNFSVTALMASLSMDCSVK
jgi:aconitate decarboxylase